MSLYSDAEELRAVLFTHDPVWNPGGADTPELFFLKKFFEDHRGVCNVLRVDWQVCLVETHRTATTQVSIRF